MTIRYLAIDSTGISFDAGETRTVEVTNEALSASSGHVGETITYTATVKDNTGVALPTNFRAELMMNGTQLVQKKFKPSVYNSVTFLLTLYFSVPQLWGSFIVKLHSEEQVI